MNNKELYQLLDGLIEKKTLAIYRCATRNYDILTSLPTTIPELKSKTGLSKMPLYRRVDQLNRLGLVNHKKGCGELEPTELTEEVLRGIEEMRAEVNKIIKSKIGKSLDLLE